ncbi:hypothetical protein BIV23_08640 [Streptomyces monashensis]|uniref:Uncharacterized protein n=1 Tax=Streptomyces monashensis TaxID=1678012 RepID=A0A1S2QJW7_9ACTN|nr:hypothetical protein BIV23_08640 [Streptomyces monashensis]
MVADSERIGLVSDSVLIAVIADGVNPRRLLVAEDGAPGVQPQSSWTKTWTTLRAGCVPGRLGMRP